MKWLRIFGLALLLAGCGESNGGGTDGGNGDDALTRERWTSSENLQVAITELDQPPTIVTTGHDDYKPVWSVTGDMLTFFRCYEYGADLPLWKTKIGVVNTDGTGLRELTGGDYMDCNQTWSRDGLNEIIFNRLGYPQVHNNSVWMTTPDAQPGEEILLSHPQQPFEWAFSALRDGRIFVERTDMFATVPVTQSFLLTPNRGEGVGYYEEIHRPTDKQWHTLSVSPSETKIAYMLDMDDLRTTYADAVLYYAEFDIDTLTIFNPVQIGEEDLSYVDMYTRWSADESLIIYTSNRSGNDQLYAYKMADGSTVRVSTDDDTTSKFGNFEQCPK